MSIQPPNIPALSSKVDTEVKRAFEAIKGWFAKIGGDGGVVTQDSLFPSLSSNAVLAPFLDYSVPTQCRDLSVVSGFRTITLTWDSPVCSYIEVYRHTSDDLGAAQMIGTTRSSIYADVPPSASLSIDYYYWIRAVSTSGIKGSFNSTTGTKGNTGNDPEYLLGMLTNQITTGQLNTSLNESITLIGAHETEITTLQTTIAGLTSAPYEADIPYFVGAVVTYSGKTYRCIQAFTPPPNILPTDAAYWTEVPSDIYAALAIEQSVRANAIAPNYSTTKSGGYIVGNTAMYGTGIYRCNTATPNPPGAWDASKWTAVPGDLYGEYSIKLDVNGYVTGYGMVNDGTSSEFGIIADRFWFMYPNAPAYSASKAYKKNARVTYSGKQWKCTTAITVAEAWNAAHWTDTNFSPFIIDSEYGVIIDTAQIKDATITTAMIEELSVDKLTVGAGGATIPTAYIDALEVGSNVTMGSGAVISWGNLDSGAQANSDNSLIQIGGRNLIKKSGWWYAWGMDRSLADVTATDPPPGTVSASYVMQSYSSEVNPADGQPALLITGQFHLDNLGEYTLVFWAKSFFVTNATIQVQRNSDYIAIFYDSIQWGAGSGGSPIWQRYEYTFKNTVGDADDFRVVISWTTNASIFIAGLKLEQGNKATDWTPAPEDITASIDSAMTTAISTASGDSTTKAAEARAALYAFLGTNEATVIGGNYVYTQMVAADQIVVNDGYVKTLHIGNDAVTVPILALGTDLALGVGERVMVEYAYPVDTYMVGKQVVVDISSKIWGAAQFNNNSFATLDAVAFGAGLSTTVKNIRKANGTNADSYDNSVGDGFPWIVFLGGWAVFTPVSTGTLTIRAVLTCSASYSYRVRATDIAMRINCMKR